MIDGPLYHDSLIFFTKFLYYSVVQCSHISYNQIKKIENVLVQHSEITDEIKKEMILEMISDKYFKKILYVTSEKHCSVQTISKEANIPLSTVYRRLHTLIEAKLMHITGKISQNGRKNFFYKSKIKKIMIELDDGELKIKIIPNLANDPLIRI